MRFSDTVRSLFTEAPEARLEFVAKNWPKLTKAQVEAIGKADPTDNGEFVAWIARLLSAKTIRLPEDAGKIRETLKQFAWLKEQRRIRGAEADVIRYKTYGDLAEKVDELTGVHGTDEAPMIADTPGAVTVYFEHPWQIVYVRSVEACVKLASATKWCVANKGFAKKYIESGPLFFIFKNGRKFALYHQKEEQLMDPQDRGLSDAAMMEVAPALQAAGLIGFHSSGQGLRALAHAGKRHAMFTADPHAALKYAKEHNSPFPEGESVIAMNAKTSVGYATQILLGPFQKGEATIAKNGRESLEYALRATKRPFPQGEPSIVSHAIKAGCSEAYGSYVRMVAKHDGLHGLERLLKLVTGNNANRSKWTSDHLHIVRITEQAMSEMSKAKTGEDKDYDKFSGHQHKIGDMRVLRPLGGNDLKKYWNGFIVSDGTGYYILKNDRPYAIIKAGPPGITVVLDDQGRPATREIMEEIIPVFFNKESWFNINPYDPATNGGHNYLEKMTAEDVMLIKRKDLAALWIKYGKSPATQAFYNEFLKNWNVIDNINALMASGRMGFRLSRQALRDLRGKRVSGRVFDMQKYISVTCDGKRALTIEHELAYDVAWYCTVTPSYHSNITPQGLTNFVNSYLMTLSATGRTAAVKAVLQEANKQIDVHLNGGSLALLNNGKHVAESHQLFDKVSKWMHGDTKKTAPERP